MAIREYIRNLSVSYAKEWAFGRNPRYYAYDEIGGDCTNFISQCIYAGSGIMNYTSETGWYYIDANDKSPSWTGVEFLYKFLTKNEGVGPFGTEVDKIELELGDVIQLGNDKGFYHSLLVVGFRNDKFFVAAHDFDAYMKPLNSYSYKKARYIHIEAVRY